MGVGRRDAVGVVERLRAVRTRQVRDQTALYGGARLPRRRLSRDVSFETPRQIGWRGEREYPGSPRIARRPPVAASGIPHPNTRTAGRHLPAVFVRNSAHRERPRMARASPYEALVPLRFRLAQAL